MSRKREMPKSLSATPVAGENALRTPFQALLGSELDVKPEMAHRVRHNKLIPRSSSTPLEKWRATQFSKRKAKPSAMQPWSGTMPPRWGPAVEWGPTTPEIREARRHAPPREAEHDKSNRKRGRRVKKQQGSPAVEQSNRADSPKRTVARTSSGSPSFAHPPLKHRLPGLRSMGVMAPRIGTPQKKGAGTDEACQRPSPQVFTEIRRLARDAIAKAGTHSACSSTVVLSPLSKTRAWVSRADVKRERHLHLYDLEDENDCSKDGDEAPSQVSERRQMTPVSAEFSKKGAGHYVEYLGVKKWVFDNELQDEIDRKAAGKQPKKRKDKPTDKTKSRRKFPEVGGGHSWKESSAVRTSVLFLRGCGEKPKGYENPLAGSHDPKKSILIAAK